MIRLPTDRCRLPTTIGRHRTTIEWLGPIAALIPMIWLASMVGCDSSSADRQATSRSPAATDDFEPWGPGGSPNADDSETPRPPHRLSSFFRSLAKTESDDSAEFTRVLQIGDSHTASDTITARLRELFQRKFGDGGRGYVYPGLPWSSFRQEHMAYGASSEWETLYGFSDDSSPPFGAGGLRVSTDEKGAWLERRSCGIGDKPDDEEKERSMEPCTLGKTFERFAIFYLVQPDGGSFTVEVDGSDPTIIRTDGEERRLGVYRRGVARGRHTIRVEARGDGRISLFGIHTSKGDNGLIFSSLGINGATADTFTGYDRKLLQREVGAIDPDLMIFAFGTNSAYNLHRLHNDPDVPTRRVTSKLTDYQFQYAKLIQRYKAAAPSASCLVLLPPDVAPPRGEEDDEDSDDSEASDDKRRCRTKKQLGDEKICIPPAVRHYGGVVAAQRAAAQRFGCAVWNQSGAMGGAGSIQYWAALEPPLARSDGIHLTMDGYHTLAEAFFSDMMRAYQGWRSGNRAPLRTHPIDLPKRRKAARSSENGGR